MCSRNCELFQFYQSISIPGLGDPHLATSLVRLVNFKVVENKQINQDSGVNILENYFLFPRIQGPSSFVIPKAISLSPSQLIKNGAQRGA